MTSLSSVRTRVRLFNVAVHGSLVLHEICRSSDLVNTCYQDLQRLIEFCSEHVAFLTSRDDILSHVNGIIDTASNVLSAACQVLERFRTGTRRGSKTSLHMRIEWLTTGSHEFRNLEPVIRQHHAAVLTELGSLRSMAMAPPPEWEELDDGKENTTRHSNDAMERAVFDNLALLGDIIGDSFAVASSPPESLPTTPPRRSHVVPRKPLAEDSCLPEPVFPNVLPEPLASSVGASSCPRPLSPAWGQAGSDSRGQTVGQDDELGLSLLFGV